MRRKTRETSVAVRLRLDGAGRADVDVPDRWLRHMLESLCRFAGFDVTVKARGDMLHHVNEDIAIALGREFRERLKGRDVRRIGSAVVPMDDALVLVGVDLVDRPFSDVRLPDEMLEHFLRSFAAEARINVHSVVLKGKNFHHINEACFKALGLALKEAAARSGDRVMSTKGRVRWRR